MLADTEQVGVFDFNMPQPIARLCDIELISFTATFSVLEFQWPSGETEASPLQTYSHNGVSKLRYVKRFQLASGIVLAHFYRPSLAATTQFNPLTIPGNILWLKADSLALSDGAQVASWGDGSGLGNHATQATAGKRPIYVAVSPENGLPAVRFDGVNDILQLTNELPATATVFVAMATRAAPSNSSVIICDSGSAGGGILLVANLNGIFGYPNNNWGGVNISSAANSCGEDLVTNQWNVLTEWIAPIFPAYRCYRNGVQKFNVASSSYGGPGPFSAIAGQGNEAAGTFLRADFGEVLVYNTALSDTDRLAIEDYLGRWT